ncbi:putative Xaa-Pro aminopeptidase P [Thelohanellus kitauei]|uniref:Putative Xaa-Pro aminopeptidase P n=1 Tax=Thelohanellus kitauei TaxID=669202 RepID=A0A0C2J2R3_THEKT|nr:putative Xaa-Pro aminopeptidase P [Thelohanellus kitauei]
MCLDENWTLMKDGNPGVPKLIDWLVSLPEGYRIGTDPSLITYGDWENYSVNLKRSGKLLLPIKPNFVDIVWEEMGKQKEELSRVFSYDIEFSGLSWQQKVKKIREAMTAKKSELLVLSALDEIAWLFNLRGSDVPHCPVFKAYALVTHQNIYLFIDVKRLPDVVLDILNVNNSHNGDFVTIYPYDSIESNLGDISKDKSGIWVNSSTPQSLIMQMPERFIIETNPVTKEKAIKNTTELNCIKNACLREAALLCDFFGHLETIISNKPTTEIDASLSLSARRSKLENIAMDSFETILSVGSNCAIIHYRPTHENSKTLNKNEMILCDTGGNYLDGTTDITRTLHFGTPSDFEKECYTRVLKAHIAVATAKFVKDATGSQIDGMARQHLWRVGLDFRHGIGHGIGMFLNVHEGPQSISSRSISHNFEIGNVLSNEPGVYLEGRFGIRIESMVTVVPFSPQHKISDWEFLQFETISLVPMHRNLIDRALLTQEEIEWLNDFHLKCVEKLTPILQKHNFTDGLRYLKENAVCF